MIYYFNNYFFFSSRRRHTRFDCDWSSDVCSSDLPAMPAIVKDDPWWFADPHRANYTRQGLLGPTVPTFWTSNPAYAQVQNEHVWQTAWAEIKIGRASCRERV